MTWTIIFMMVVLKIPILYVGAVIYYAIKAEPNPLEPAELEQDDFPSPWKPWDHYKYNRRRPRPSHGGPDRRAPRGSRAVTKRTHAQ